MSFIVVSQASGQAKIFRDAADQETGSQAGVFQNPGKHGTGSGFAMGAGNSQYPAIMQQVLREPLRAGCVGQMCIQYRFHKWVAACHNVADHKQIWRQFDLISIVAFNQLNVLVA